jgi:hypothetical protein
MRLRAWTLVAVALVAGSAAGDDGRDERRDTTRRKSDGPDHSTAADLNPVKYLKKPRHPPADLVRNGNPRAAIHLAIPPSPTLTLVVKELVESIRVTTGATLPVSVAPQPPAAGVETLIVVGDCPAAREAGIDVDQIAVEGFEVLTAADKIFIVGNVDEPPDLALTPGQPTPGPYGNEGNAWGVADFMERFVGVRWYWSPSVGGRSVVETPTLSVAPAHYRDAPAFRIRWYAPHNGFDQSLWVARTSEGTRPDLLPRPTEAAIPKDVPFIDMTTCLTCLRAGGSWPYLAKPEQPLVLRRTGPVVNRRQAFVTQTETRVSLLCYTMPETMSLLEDCLTNAWSPDGAFHDERLRGFTPGFCTSQAVTVTPAPMALACTCDACRQSLAAGGAGEHANRFVRTVCGGLEKQWPGKRVVYLPASLDKANYPQGDFPENLEVQLATSGFGPPRNPQGSDPAREEAIDRWRRVTASGRVALSESSAGLASKTHAPTQFPHTLQQYYRRRRQDTVGVFVNGHALNEWAGSAPTLHCWMKLLWNPDVDVDAILLSFCNRMFGKAAPQMREYVALQCVTFQQSTIHPALPDMRENIDGLRRLYPPAAVARFTELRDQARKLLVDDPVSLQRMEYFTWTLDPFRTLYEGK